MDSVVGKVRAAEELAQAARDLRIALRQTCAEVGKRCVV